MEIKINKKDVVWGYITMAFNYGTGLFTLPFILSMLSAEEVGMNYLMLAISNLVILADFGFSQQFGRNLTYILSGAQSLQKEGISGVKLGAINYQLVATLIKTAKFVYLRMSLLVLAGMLTLGTIYIYHVTQGFTNIPNSLFIWLLFSVSTFFNFYYKYYTTLLTGSALMMEYNKSCIYSKIVYIAICVGMLFLGCGLMSVVVANFISPFVQRYYSYISFYTDEIKDGLRGQVVTTEDIREMTSTLWFNAKKLGIIFVGQYGISQSGIFFSGLFLSLEEVAAYGLMMQLINNILCSISKSLFNSISPLFSKDTINHDISQLIRHFSLGNFIFWCIFIVGSLMVIFVAPPVLDLIHSNSHLPSTLVMLVFSIDALLDYNHANFTYILTAQNRFPFVKADLITGMAVVFINLVTLYFTDWGLLGLVLGRLCVMLAYNDWKWPSVICQELNVPITIFVKVGYQETCYKLQMLIKNRK